MVILYFPRCGCVHLFPDCIKSVFAATPTPAESGRVAEPLEGWWNLWLCRCYWTPTEGLKLFSKKALGRKEWLSLGKFLHLLQQCHLNV